MCIWCLWHIHTHTHVVWETVCDGAKLDLVRGNVKNLRINPKIGCSGAEYPGSWSPTHPHKIGTSHGRLKNFGNEQSRITPPLHPTHIGTSHGGLCAVDWCVRLPLYPRGYRLVFHIAVIKSLSQDDCDLILCFRFHDTKKSFTLNDVI